MTKKTKERIIQIFAIVSILGMIVSSFASSFFFLF